MLKEKYKDIPVYVIKIKDNKFDGKHPNHINEGYEVSGYIGLGEVGNCLYVSNMRKYLRTSIIKSIEECDGYDLVHTENSTYKIEVI
jgi:hypothetical protein